MLRLRRLAIKYGTANESPVHHSKGDSYIVLPEICRGHLRRAWGGLDAILESRVDGFQSDKTKSFATIQYSAPQKVYIL